MKQYTNICAGALSVLEDVLPKMKDAVENDQASQDDWDVIIARLETLIQAAKQPIEPPMV